MNKVEEIKTIKKPAEVKFKEKGSLFLSKSFYVSSEKGVEEITNKLKKEFYDATHHCFAYRMNSGSSANNFRYSDDGEPSGTAGIRILNAIDHFELKDCLIVVIRYFGGTKLGVGPLGKAYYNSAIDVIEASGIIIQKPFREITLTCAFSQLNFVHRILTSYDARIISTNYDEVVKFICIVEADKTESLKSEINEASQGQIEILINDLLIYA
jgi:uncharacterized YigZ family protein